MLGWLDKRIPQAKQFQLDMRSIFIFQSKFGFLALCLCLTLFLLGTNYQNNLILLLCYFLVSIFILNVFVSYLNFSRIQIHLGKTVNVFAGDSLQLPLWLNSKNDSPKRPSGILSMGFWKQTPVVSFDLDELQNPHYLAFKAEQRGPLSLPRITLNSVYPLGLFNCWTHLSFATDIVVYPKPVQCPLSIIHGSDSDLSMKTSLSVVGNDDFDSLKTYARGESLNHVAWKQLAKGQGMYSKQFSSEVSTVGWLTLLPCSSDELELRLSQLTYQVIELTCINQSFGLDLGNTKIDPDFGLQHQQKCLQALAVFEWS
jgi:uncharacterized protein (DUF58 family)